MYRDPFSERQRERKRGRHRIALPWAMPLRIRMDTPSDATLLQRLSAFWDNQSPRTRILLIICGSLALSEAITAVMSVLLLGEIDRAISSPDLLPRSWSPSW